MTLPINPDEYSFDVSLPMALVMNLEIEPAALRLYALIKGLTRMRGYCFATNAYLAERLNCGESSVRRWLNSLKEEGFLEIETIKEGIVSQRRIFLGVELKKCLRRFKNERGGAQNQRGGCSKMSTRYRREEEKKEEDTVCKSEGGCAPPDPEKRVPEMVTKKSPEGHDVHIDLSDIFRQALRAKKNWDTQEIQQAWKILVEYPGFIRDPFRFIEGTIDKLNNAKKSAHLEKEKAKCALQKKQKNTTENCKPNSSAPVTEELVSLESIFQKHSQKKSTSG